MNTMKRCSLLVMILVLALLSLTCTCTSVLASSSPSSPQRDPAQVYREAHAAALAAAASTTFRQHTPPNAAISSLLPHPDAVAAAIAADLGVAITDVATADADVADPDVAFLAIIDVPNSVNAVPETCLGCIELTSFIAPLAVSKVGVDVLKGLTFAYCFAKSIDCDGWLQCTELCDGIANTYVQEVVDILAERQLSPVELCADIDVCPAPPMPEPRPGIPVPSNLSDPTGQRTWPSWSTTTGTGAILHLSDIHLDSQYVAGTNTQCGLPLCCRAGNGQGTNASNTAGEFGDYNCDTPPALFSSMLAFVQSSASAMPDFVLYTGDDPAHDIWEQSQDANIDSMREVVQQLQQALTDVPVFHAVGNHEMYPVDQFLGPGGDSWLYSALAVSWSYYLPQDAIRTLRYGGYYQTLARPGLRVISLNTNVYASGDFYTEFTNRTDFSSQFAWLDDVLVQCAQRGERAILIGHSEPRAWFTEFAETFRALLYNHSSTIMNVFFGHSHTAQLQVFHANTSATNGGNNFSEPFLTAFIGGSITPYTELNPGLVMYAYNRSNIATAPFLVTDFVQSYFDLPTANAKGSINWTETQHQGLQFLGVPDLSPAALSKLAQGWLYEPTSNSTLVSFGNYMQYYYKGAVPGNQQPGGYACDVLTVVDADDTMCDSGATSVLREKLGREPDASTKPMGERCSAEHVKAALREMMEKETVMAAAAAAAAAAAQAAKVEAEAEAMARVEKKASWFSPVAVVAE